MINLIIESQNNLYTASRDGEEAHNIAGNSLFDVYAKAAGLWGTDDSDFDFSEFSFQSSCYQAEWNSDLPGYVVVFADGAHILAGFGEAYIERYTECDDDLSDEQKDRLDEFVSSINKIKNNF